MRFTGRKLVITGIVLGMISSFLLGQPTVRKGILSLTSYFYSYLPTSLARFLRGQTFLTLTFFWMLMIFGIIMWIVRGDFLRAESHFRREKFKIVKSEDENETKEKDFTDE